MASREQWHLSEEAVYAYLDRTLGTVALAEVESHLRSCPECSRSLRRAKLLFARLEAAAPPRLDRDLSSGVVADLQTARNSSRRWNRLLAAEALAAAVAIAMVGFRLEDWYDVLLAHPAYLSLRGYGLRLVADVATCLAPFFTLVPSYPSRLASMRVPVPDLEGPILWWAGLGVAALALGLVGNAVLLRSANGVAERTLGGADVGGKRSNRPRRRSRGGGL